MTELTYEQARRIAIRRGLIRPRGIIEAAGRNFAQEVGVNATDDLIGAFAGPEAQANWNRELAESQTDRPVSSFVGGAGGWLVPAAAALKGARLAGLGARTALYGSSAAQGAVHGAMSEGTPAERATNTGVGALAGVGGAGAGEFLGQLIAITTRQGLDPAVRAARLANRSLRESTASAQDVQRRLVRQGVRPNTAAAQSRALAAEGDLPRYEIGDLTNRAAAANGRTGTPMAFQMAPGWRRDARAVHAVSGPGQGLLEQTINARRDAMGGEIATGARNAFFPRQTRSPGSRGRQRNQVAKPAGINEQPPLSGFQEYGERLDVARKGQNREAYDAAYRAALTPEQRAAAARRMSGGAFKEKARQSAFERTEEDIARLADDLDNMQASGASSAAIERAAWELADTEAAQRALQTLGQDAATPLNARALDFYQRGLRHLADKEGGFATEGGRNIAQVRATFMRNMRTISPALHQAIGTARGFRDLDEALLLGRNLFRDSKQGEIDALLRKQMATDEQDAFLIGALEAIEDKLARGELQFVRALQRNENWRALIGRAANSKKAATRLINLIDDKADNLESYGFIQGGSPTAPIGQDIQRLTTGESELGFIHDLIQAGGDPRNPLLKRLAGAYDRLARPGIYNPQVQREYARILTMPATKRNMAQLAQRLQSASRASVFTPQAQRAQTIAGQFGAGAATQLDPEAAAEITGAPQLARAGDALGRGDYLRAGLEGAAGSLMALPFIGGASLPVKTAAALGGAGVFGAGVAHAQSAAAEEQQRLQNARARVAELEAIERRLHTGSVEDKQRFLVEQGYNVLIDGRMGSETERAIAELRLRNNAQLQEAAAALRELNVEDVARRTRPSSAQELWRETAPYVAPIAGGLVGEATRGLALLNVGRKINIRNRTANDLITRSDVPTSRSAAAARIERVTRASRINDFWRHGGAGERVPFESARTPLGYKARRSSAPPSALFPPASGGRFRSNDAAALLTAGGEASFATVALAGAQRELQAAQRAVDANPSESNRMRLERARDQVVNWQAAQRFGLGFGLARVGGLAHKYPESRPDISAAENEMMQLNQLLAPRRRPFAPRSSASKPNGS